MTTATKKRGRSRPAPTADQKAEWAEQREAKMTGLLTTLDSAVAELVTEDAWKRMLDVAARFHHYSPNNIMLILAQRPDATRVAGFRTWVSVGRFVRKGERGITILAPMVRKGEVEDPDTGEKSTVRALRGFRGVAVFDVSQTDGDPLPDVGPSMLEGEGDGAVHEALIAQIEDAGYTYAEPDTIDGWPGANGLTNYLDRTVQVHAGMDPAQRVKTTAHELAHVLMHGPDRPSESRAVGEIEAESVAYVVLGALGYDTSAYSVGYVTGWSGGDTAKLKASRDRVLITARAILEQIAPAGDAEDEAAA